MKNGLIAQAQTKPEPADTHVRIDRRLYKSLRVEAASRGIKATQVLAERLLLSYQHSPMEINGVILDPLTNLKSKPKSA